MTSNDEEKPTNPFKLGTLVQLSVPPVNPKHPLLADINEYRTLMPVGIITQEPYDQFLHTDHQIMVETCVKVAWSPCPLAEDLKINLDSRNDVPTWRLKILSS